MEHFGHKGYWLPHSFLLLAEYRTNCSFACVGLYSEWISFCWDGEDDILRHLLLQLLEGLVLGHLPGPLCVPCELSEGVHDLRVVLDEFSIEVHEA